MFNGFSRDFCENYESDKPKSPPINFTNSSQAQVDLNQFSFELNFFLQNPKSTWKSCLNPLKYSLFQKKNIWNSKNAFSYLSLYVWNAKKNS